MEVHVAREVLILAVPLGEIVTPARRPRLIRLENHSPVTEHVPTMSAAIVAWSDASNNEYVDWRDPEFMTPRRQCLAVTTERGEIGIDPRAVDSYSKPSLEK